MYNFLVRKSGFNYTLTLLLKLIFFYLKNTVIFLENNAFRIIYPIRNCCWHDAFVSHSTPITPDQFMIVLQRVVVFLH